MNNGKQVSPLMRELSSYIAGALKRKLPAEVVERAKLHLVDTFAAMVSGSRLPPGKLGIAYVKSLGGKREAGVIGTPIVTTAALAALANGICGHADETDDIYSPGRSHPGAANVPAALAMAERQQLAGEAMLRALVLGYDISTRVVLALKQELVARAGFHPSSKGGVFGAAAAAGALVKLDALRVRHMLAYCAEQAAGLLAILREPEHNQKAYVVGGMPAHNGVTAALMAASGFTGVADALYGEGNFFSVFSSDADREALVRGLGRDYEILRCSIKYWPVGGPIQAPMHVLRDIIRQHKIKAGDVERLVVRMPDTALKIVDNRNTPNITVQHLLALMLVDGTVTFASTHDFSRMKDPRVLKLRRNRIEVIGDAKLTTPLRHWCCNMEITLKDGRRLTHQTMAAKGYHENPLTRQDIEEKALDLMAPILGKKRSQALISALLNIETIKDARELRRLYTVK